MSKDKVTPALPTNPIPRGFSGNVFYHLGMLLTRCLTHFELRGRENLPTDQNFVLVANHETYVDGMWIASILRHSQFKQFCALVGADLMRDHGWFGKIICRVGQGIPVNRKANPVRGLILAKKQVESGRILLVHPEGTRTSNGKLAPLQDGASYIAHKTHVPLVPVYIDGGFQLFNRFWKLPKPFLPGSLRRKRLILKVGAPLFPERFSDVQEITAALRSWFLAQEAKREVHEMQSLPPEAHHA